MHHSLMLVVVSFFLSSPAWALTPLPAPQDHSSLRTECDRIEESYPDFACLRFEFYQSSPDLLHRDLQELTDLNDWRLEEASWPRLMELLMISMDTQIYRYNNPIDIETLRRTKAKNQWALLKLKAGLRHFWMDPNTYWFPSVNAMSFVAVNSNTYQILVISHGERN